MQPYLIIGILNMDDDGAQRASSACAFICALIERSFFLENSVLVRFLHV